MGLGRVPALVAAVADYSESSVQRIGKLTAAGVLPFALKRPRVLATSTLQGVYGQVPLRFS